ncbi:Serpentine Receptor, class H [Caenorhabditis elegans]|uniref:Serpentine Receptor, class H n=1 Tax=Caenorhabditis elegans TaxID=6239 RepID=O16397_CAEEL|nr:Serpentine Receptor, class H [Caenorhabditis elegans]CCD64867.1 Serpentine Receptor, class H [Caenorhabditis elegans]|eukprot:NP_504079.2 Serpentine Receptor, class H [Caenorhabditis elegans]
MIDCIPESGYFDSPDFLANTMHVFTVIATPIHIFAFYCVLAKTEDQMKSVKMYLLNLHSSIVLFDYSLNFLSCPFILIPELAGYPLGIFKYFNAPVEYYVVEVGIAGACMIISVVSIFENRFYVICTFSWRDHWTIVRRPWLLLHYIEIFVFMFSLTLIVPDQKIGLELVFENLPCLPKDIYEAPVFVLASDYTYQLIAAVFIISQLCFEIGFFVTYLVWNSYKQLKDMKISKQTFELQRKFFIALVIQLVVPSAFFVIPVAYMLASFSLYYYNQAFTNVAFIVVSIHGVSSTLAMIFLHRPYRRAIFKMIYKRGSYPSTVSKIRSTTGITVI